VVVLYPFDFQLISGAPAICSCPFFPLQRQCVSFFLPLFFWLVCLSLNAEKSGCHPPLIDILSPPFCFAIRTFLFLSGGGPHSFPYKRELNFFAITPSKLPQSSQPGVLFRVSVPFFFLGMSTFYSRQPFFFHRRWCAPFLQKDVLPSHFFFFSSFYV